MSSEDNSAIDPSQIQEAHRAARILINKYAARLEHLLVQNRVANNWLREACAIEELSYHEVMSSTSAQSITPSQSHRETPPSPLSSSHHSSSSVILSSSASNQPSSTTNSIKIVAIIDNNSEVLRAKCIANSCYLIHKDTVHNRLNLTTERLSDPLRVECNGKSQKSDERVSLKWAWSEQDMKVGRIQRNTFYLVPELPKTEVLLGHLEPQEIAWQNMTGLSLPSCKAARFLG